MEGGGEWGLKQIESTTTFGNLSPELKYDQTKTFPNKMKSMSFNQAQDLA
jgi:hypothetical protein